MSKAKVEITRPNVFSTTEARQVERLPIGAVVEVELTDGELPAYLRNKARILSDQAVEVATPGAGTGADSYTFSDGTVASAEDARDQYRAILNKEPGNKKTATLGKEIEAFLKGGE